MTTDYIDLDDIQGNITKAYGRFGYPVARYIFFKFFDSPDYARNFLHSLLPLITSARPWHEEGMSLPPATTNVAFTYEGLKNLGLPTKTLHSFPQEFSMGMKARAEILGDDGSSSAEHWDPIWQDDKSVHMFMSINAQTQEALEQRYNQIQSLLSQYSAGVQQLFGHRGKNGEDFGYQACAALMENERPSPKEHFGYVDGISNPYFKGCGNPSSWVFGAGKLMSRSEPRSEQSWAPLETGEFILGYKDEAQELPAAPIPRMLSMNGTYMVYRKLHENVGSFNRYLDELGKDYPGGREELAAKMVGRWRNGAPITSYPTKEEADSYGQALVEAELKREQASTDEERKNANAHLQQLRKGLRAYTYHNDIPGHQCPVGAHTRRANPRGALEFGQDGAFNDKPSALTNRRRLLRRGLPYGQVENSDSDDGDHGIIFMCVNASIERQFEFVQQQWMNYGNDFKLSNEKDPIIGNHNGQDHFMIQGSSAEKPPFFCAKLPRFVDTRGGEYFFIPSITAVRMMADGLIDPT